MWAWLNTLTRVYMLTIPLDNYLISFVIDASKPYDIEIIDSIYSMFKKENQVSAIRIPFPLTEHPYLSFIQEIISRKRAFDECTARTSYNVLFPT